MTKAGLIDEGSKRRIKTHLEMESRLDDLNNDCAEQFGKLSYILKEHSTLKESHHLNLEKILQKLEDLANSCDTTEHELEEIGDARYLMRRVKALEDGYKDLEVIPEQLANELKWMRKQIEGLKS